LQGRGGEGLEKLRRRRERGEAFSFQRDMAAAGEVFVWSGGEGLPAFALFEM
jgi:hypothetical protein